MSTTTCHLLQTILEWNQHKPIGNGYYPKTKTKQKNRNCKTNPETLGLAKKPHGSHFVFRRIS
jgi:hypothetical protein